MNKELAVFYGDLHSHCGISYGKGSLEDAFQNARQQLDFASITVHAHWPDIPRDDPRLNYLVDYHERGFEAAQTQWPHYQEITEQANEDGHFVTFPSFEWHSMHYGDYCIYFKDSPSSHIISADTLDSVREHLRELARKNIPAFLIPHHIGYLTGYRGINWAAFTPEFSPVVEIMSFHGLSETSESPYPYLHSMGPRDGRSTAQYGLSQGHVFGFTGSTDHHSAHPGHYGYGRLAVWAEACTRDAIWDAIGARRTYALTGDRIRLGFTLNGQPMGAVLPFARERWVEVDVAGGDALDVVEILHNNRIVHRWHPPRLTPDSFRGPVKVHIEVGWGEEPQSTEWSIDLAVAGGELREIEPRLRGHGIEPPPEDIANRFVLSHVERPEANRVRWSTVTWRNPTISTPATQGLCLTIQGDAHTQLKGRINGQDVQIALGDLVQGARTQYLSGFVSPAVCFHRLVPEESYRARFGFQAWGDSAKRDWYYVRVRQQNGHHAWSSPVWVASR